MSTPPHIGFFTPRKKLTSACGKDIEVIEVTVEDNPAKLSSWAAHLREQYISMEMLPKMVEGTGKSTKDYLLELKFPSQSGGFGPATRSGDFCEILVSDYLEFLQGYLVPRTRYDNKTVKNESTKGEDILAFKTLDNTIHPEDEMIVCEVKGKLSGSAPDARLQVAVDACPEDESRIAESLNALKQRLYLQGRDSEAKCIERFQNPSDYPYHRVLAAAAVVCTQAYCQSTLSATDTSNHKKGSEINKLLTFRSSDLMTVVHAIYKRAADEA